MKTVFLTVVCAALLIPATTQAAPAGGMSTIAYSAYGVTYAFSGTDKTTVRRFASAWNSGFKGKQISVSSYVGAPRAAWANTRYGIILALYTKTRAQAKAQVTAVAPMLRRLGWTRLS